LEVLSEQHAKQIKPRGQILIDKSGQARVSGRHQLDKQDVLNLPGILNITFLQILDALDLSTPLRVFNLVLQLNLSFVHF